MSKKPEKPETRKAKAPSRAPKQRRASVVTEAEAAAMDFEPWPGEILEKRWIFSRTFPGFFDAAWVRLIAAGSSVCQNTPEKCGERGRERGNA